MGWLQKFGKKIGGKIGGIKCCFGIGIRECYFKNVGIRKLENGLNGANIMMINGMKYANFAKNK